MEEVVHDLLFKGLDFETTIAFTTEQSHKKRDPCESLPSFSLSLRRNACVAALICLCRTGLFFPLSLRPSLRGDSQRFNLMINHLTLN